MQKNIYVVPWADKYEWQDVRKKIYSEKTEDVIEAYETMTVWQTRTENLPAYVDCTAGILQVMVQEYLNKKSVLSDYDLRLAYSTALIRFINHVHDVSDLKKNSLYRAAKTQNIPDWLITMRHDAAHGRILPALETFHLAAKVSLQWLLENYWFQEEKYRNNLGANHFEDDITMSNLNFGLLPIYKTAIKIYGMCCDLMNNSVNLTSDLSEDQLSHIDDLIYMCQTNDSLKKNGLNCITWLKKIRKVCKTRETFQESGKKILKALKLYIRELLQSITYDDAAKYTFVQSLLQSDFMLDTSKNDWESVIRLVQTLRCFSVFLDSVSELVAIENDMAVNLLHSLLPSIEILKWAWSHYMKLLKSGKGKGKTKKCIKKSILAKFRKKCKNVDFQLALRVPPKITFDVLQNVLSNPNELSCNVALKCLSLVQPPLTEAHSNEIRRLIGIYCGSETFGDESTEETEKMYTLEDIRLQIENKGTENDISDCGNWSWVKSDESIEKWSSCPLGLLPHQKRVDCNLPKDVMWKTESSSKGRKRPACTLLTSQAEGMKKLKKSLKIIDK